VKPIPFDQISLSADCDASRQFVGEKREGSLR
jgi:hypothetical protein